MDKKEIQKKRMMNYFIEAAKEIIVEEGIQSLSVRKVGDRAGYSYATIYNYFKDLNALLYYCIIDYLENCHEYVNVKLKNTIDPRERIELLATAYIEYFAKNPNQFQLIFVEDVGEPPEELLEKLYRPSVAVLAYEEIIAYSNKANIKAVAAETLCDLIASSMHGKLLMYLTGRKNIDVKSLIQSIKAELDFLFNKL